MNPRKLCSRFEQTFFYFCLILWGIFDRGTKIHLLHVFYFIFQLGPRYPLLFLVFQHCENQSCHLRFCFWNWQLQVLPRLGSLLNLLYFIFLWGPQKRNFVEIKHINNSAKTPNIAQTSVRFLQYDLWRWES